VEKARDLEKNDAWKLDALDSEGLEKIFCFLDNKVESKIELLIYRCMNIDLSPPPLSLSFSTF
jgi:hypothetical protein